MRERDTTGIDKPLKMLGQIPRQGRQQHTFILLKGKKKENSPSNQTVQASQV